MTMLCDLPPRMVQHEVVGAFDSLAARYDELFTRSAVGRAQRDAVWEVLLDTFEPGSHILELNCGTGEDALFLDDNNMSLVACDASEQMIKTARLRMMAQNPQAAIHFEVLPTEYLNELSSEDLFDGVLSNFSGLNCVEDLGQVAKDLAGLVMPHAPVVICLSTRFCLTEILWFLLQGDVRKAFRRISGVATAHVDQFAVTVRYPTLREVRKSFAPFFHLNSCTGIGITVPPSYLETRISKYPRLLKLLQSIDRRIRCFPWFRTIGDHMLLCFERVETKCC
jgi:ubiquinone/menaquinone biosynthesis C-methylase UbiE